MEMILGFIILTVVVNCLTTQTSADSTAKVWGVLRVPNPPSSTETPFNETWLSVQSKFDLTPKFSVHADVRFELFTPKNPSEKQFLRLGDSMSVKNSNFNPKLPTRFFIHGWKSDGSLAYRFADAYFDLGKHKLNFIAVDWTKGSSTSWYPFARGYVNELAAHLAMFIDFLVEKHNLKLNDLIIVGHSLGAHVAGIAGKRVTKGKVGKIVGLDPAGPLFSYNDIHKRLHANDAIYVESIQTSAGLIGFNKPLGKATFYPNGGTKQPGCYGSIFSSCSHSRAYELYLESIIFPNFYAFECNSFEEIKNGRCNIVNDLVQMGGEPGIKNAKGFFFLETNAKSLFSQGSRVRSLMNMFLNGSLK